MLDDPTSPAPRACSANSAVVLRKLEALLENLDEDVDVVSVHSPKYDGEASSDALEAALQRIEVQAHMEWQRGRRETHTKGPWMILCHLTM